MGGGDSDSDRMDGKISVPGGRQLWAGRQLSCYFSFLKEEVEEANYVVMGYSGEHASSGKTARDEGKLCRKLAHGPT